MSINSPWPLPPKLAETAESPDRVKFYMRLAVACTDDGKVPTLATLLGVTPNVVHLARFRGRCSHDLAIRIEKLFGRELFPRELFNSEPVLP